LLGFKLNHLSTLAAVIALKDQEKKETENKAGSLFKKSICKNGVRA